MKFLTTALLSVHTLAQLANTAAVPDADGNNLFRSVASRELAHDISLGYGAEDVAASIGVTLKLPAIVLEDLSGLGSVKCSGSQIALTFTDSAVFEAASTTWPKSGFVIVTYSPDGACNGPDERGFYSVSSEDLDAEALTIHLEVEASSLKEQSKSSTINFQTGLGLSKRDISATISADLAGTLVDTSNLTLVARQALFESTIRLNGRLDFDIEASEAKAVELDIDYSTLVNLNLSAFVEGEIPTDLLNLNPIAVPVSAFSIPGIIDVGPIAEFSLGIEFGAGGTLNVTLDAAGGIESGKVHLDLLDSAKTATSGWTPSFKIASDIDALVSIQLNPFIELTLSVGIKAFSGILDISAGFDVQPKIINQFSVDGDVTFDSASGIKLNPPVAGECNNGAWYACSLGLDVDTFVSPFYRKTLFEVTQPIYKSQCWTIEG
ncbi:hypothetical protein EDB80DRAFT_842923 [Ilyonectria destructans]|nr:hypothetical protein EDB80DRAFT_842923 [Ilyonectria destructans]